MKWMTESQAQRSQAPVPQALLSDKGKSLGMPEALTLTRMSFGFSRALNYQLDESLGADTTIPNPRRLSADSKYRILTRRGEGRSAIVRHCYGAGSAQWWWQKTWVSLYIEKLLFLFKFFSVIFSTSKIHPMDMEIVKVKTP